MLNVHKHILPMGTSASRFEYLFRLHYQKFFACARRMSGNLDDAEDLVQDAFYRAFRSYDRYDHECPFDRWVIRIISNLYIDSVRVRNRAVLISLDAPLPGNIKGNLAEELPDSRQDPAVKLMSEVIDERLITALEQLSKSFRSTILLVDVYELTYEQAAKRLDCSVGTIRSRVHRARKQLKMMLSS